MNKVIDSAVKFLRSNSPVILTSGAVVGTVATAVLTGRASYEAALDIHKEFGPDVSRKEKIKFVWRRYIPAGVAGVATIACVIGSNRASSRRIVAATMAYSVTEQAFTKYKEKIVEQIGINKEQAVRDEIVAEKIRNNPVPTNIVVSGQGVLCCEVYTGRYFVSDMETLKQSENILNSQLLRDDRARLDDFYHLVNLVPTQYSDEIGWETPRLMELQFRTVLSPDGRPCLAFEYNYVKPLH